MVQELEDIIKKEKKLSLISVFSNFFLGIGGEFMQQATIDGLMDYNWLTGHLSDFAVSAEVTAFFMYLTAGKNKYLRAIATVLPATIATIHEFFPFFNLGYEYVFDPQDVAMYWVGAAVTYAGVKLLSRR